MTTAAWQKPLFASRVGAASMPTCCPREKLSGRCCQGMAWRHPCGAGSEFAVAVVVAGRVFADKRAPRDITFVRAIIPLPGV